MATVNGNDDDTTIATSTKSTTNMNIVTYATPVSVSPDRVWAVGLFKDTLSYHNFCQTRSCILQLLTNKHIPLVKVLGGSSGREVDKQTTCQELGFAWKQLGEKSDMNMNMNMNMPMVLPGCAHYLKLEAIGELHDCGSHVVAICKVQGMFSSMDHDQAQQPHLMTARLRELGIITEQGRVAKD